LAPHISHNPAGVIGDKVHASLNPPGVIGDKCDTSRITR